MSIKAYNQYGEAFEKSLLMRNSPIAVKMIKTESEIPKGAIRPKKDRGHHIAQCQAFALARRQGETIAMLKEDHWCFAPLMAYGLVEDPQDEFVNAVTSFPRFKEGEYIGMVTGPMQSASFEPDLAMLYLEPNQVLKILMVVKTLDNAHVVSEFDPIDSCAYAVVPVIEKDECKIAIPDPGEYARTAVREDELIFSIPKSKIAKIAEALTQMKAKEKDDLFRNIELAPDFHRPPFYKRLFEKWGLDIEE